MTDIFDQKKRREIMRRNKGKHTQPEMVVRKLIYKMGYRYRLHGNDLPGKPDIVFRKNRKVIFVHGCFWHHHEGCPKSHIPKSNLAYWLPKLERTKQRDKEHLIELEGLGWDILVIWECQIKDTNILKQIIQNFLS